MKPTFLSGREGFKPSHSGRSATCPFNEAVPSQCCLGVPKKWLVYTCTEKDVDRRAALQRLFHLVGPNEQDI